MPLKTIYLLGFLDAFKFAIALPATNPHVMSLGKSFMFCGILNSAVAAMELLSSPVIGSWSDSYGRRRMLLLTLVGSFIGDAIAANYSFPLFFLGRILYGATHHTDPLTKAAVSDIIPDKQMQSDAFNKLLVLPAFAFIIAPVLGGILYQQFGSFTVISLVLCTVDALLIAMVYMNIPNVKIEKKIEEKKNRNWKKYLDLLSIKLAVEIAYNFFIANSALILVTKYAYTEIQIGLFIAYVSITMTLGAIFTPHINKRFYPNDSVGSVRIFHTSFIILMCFVILPMVGNPILHLLLFLPAGLAKFMLEISWMEALTTRTTETEKGLAMGLATSMLSGAGLVCPLISGVVADYIGIHILTLLPLFPSAVGAILANRIQKPHIN